MILHSIKLFFIVLIPMIIIDGMWLTSTSKPFYQKFLRKLMTAHPLYVPVVIFYILYAIGVAYFIVAPALAGNLLWWEVLLRGAFLGLLAYAAYDLTNNATLMNWPVVVTIVDMAWGATMTGLTSLIAFLIMKVI